MKQYNSEEWQTLFEKWRQNPDYSRFVEDGILCPEVWQSRADSGRRILFVLKEYNGTEWKADDAGLGLQDFTLSNDFKAPIWRRVAEWMMGLDAVRINGPVPPYVALDNKAEHYPEILEQLRKIAAINLKKDAGGASAVYDEIMDAAGRDKDLIRWELDLIDPDVIVCGGTSEFLMSQVYPDVFGSIKEWEETLRKPMWEKGYCFASLEQRERLIIDYYHPACQYPKKLTYYALVGLFQTALRERHEREAP